MADNQQKDKIWKNLDTNECVFNNEEEEAQASFINTANDNCYYKAKDILQKLRDRKLKACGEEAFDKCAIHFPDIYPSAPIIIPEKREELEGIGNDAITAYCTAGEGREVIRNLPTELIKEPNPEENLNVPVTVPKDTYITYVNKATKQEIKDRLKQEVNTLAENAALIQLTCIARNDRVTLNCDAALTDSEAANTSFTVEADVPAYDVATNYSYQTSVFDKTYYSYFYNVNTSKYYEVNIIEVEENGQLSQKEETIEVFPEIAIFETIPESLNNYKLYFNYLGKFFKEDVTEKTPIVSDDVSKKFIIPSNNVINSTNAPSAAGLTINFEIIAEDFIAIVKENEIYGLNFEVLKKSSADSTNIATTFGKNFGVVNVADYTNVVALDAKYAANKQALNDALLQIRCKVDNDEKVATCLIPPPLPEDKVGKESYYKLNSYEANGDPKKSMVAAKSITKDVTKFIISSEKNEAIENLYHLDLSKIQDSINEGISDVEEIIKAELNKQALDTAYIRLFCEYGNTETTKNCDIGSKFNCQEDGTTVSVDTYTNVVSGESADEIKTSEEKLEEAVTIAGNSIITLTDNELTSQLSTFCQVGNIEISAYCDKVSAQNDYNKLTTEEKNFTELVSASTPFINLPLSHIEETLTNKYYINLSNVLPEPITIEYTQEVVIATEDWEPVDENIRDKINGGVYPNIDELDDPTERLPRNTTEFLDFTAGDKRDLAYILLSQYAVDGYYVFDTENAKGYILYITPEGNSVDMQEFDIQHTEGTTTEDISVTFSYPTTFAEYEEIQADTKEYDGVTRSEILANGLIEVYYFKEIKNEVTSFYKVSASEANKLICDIININNTASNADLVKFPESNEEFKEIVNKQYLGYGLFDFIGVPGYEAIKSEETADKITNYYDFSEEFTTKTEEGEEITITECYRISAYKQSGVIFPASIKNITIENKLYFPGKYNEISNFLNKLVASNVESAGIVPYPYLFMDYDSNNTVISIIPKDYNFKNIIDNRTKTEEEVIADISLYSLSKLANIKSLYLYLNNYTTYKAPNKIVRLAKTNLGQTSIFLPSCTYIKAKTENADIEQLYLEVNEETINQAISSVYCLYGNLGLSKITCSEKFPDEPSQIWRVETGGDAIPADVYFSGSPEDADNTAKTAQDASLFCINQNWAGSGGGGSVHVNNSGTSCSGCQSTCCLMF